LCEDKSYRHLVEPAASVHAHEVARPRGRRQHCVTARSCAWMIIREDGPTAAKARGRGGKGPSLHSGAAPCSSRRAGRRWPSST
jgi:hypothetical protein